MRGASLLIGTRRAKDGGGEALQIGVHVDGGVEQSLDLQAARGGNEDPGELGAVPWTAAVGAPVIDLASREDGWPSLGQALKPPADRDFWLVSVGGVAFLLALLAARTPTPVTVLVCRSTVGISTWPAWTSPPSIMDSCFWPPQRRSLSYSRNSPVPAAANTSRSACGPAAFRCSAPRVGRWSTLISGANWFQGRSAILSADALVPDGRATAAAD